MVMGFAAMACLVACLVHLACFAGPAVAEEATSAQATSTQALGNAVHAYNTGNFQEAFDHLTPAIDGNSEDPRVHFFRGLALMQLGKSEEAEKEFKAGARLEAGDAVGVYNVNRALERIQGKGRLTIEKLRREAKAEALKKREAAREARREQLQRNEERVIEKARPGAANPKDPLGEPPASESPAKKNEPMPEEKPEEKPAEPTKP